MQALLPHIASISVESAADVASSTPPSIPEPIIAGARGERRTALFQPAPIHKICRRSALPIMSRLAAMAKYQDVIMICYAAQRIMRRKFG